MIKFSKNKLKCYNIYVIFFFLQDATIFFKLFLNFLEDQFIWRGGIHFLREGLNSKKI